MNEQVLRYHDAAQLARQILGDDTACRYFDRLNKLARTNSLTELKSIILGWRNAELNPHLGEIDKAIKTGVQFRAGGLWDAKKDAVQSAWAALLESGKSDAPAANTAGQTAARTIVRTERRFVPFPELANEDGSVETIHPCDISDFKAGDGGSELSAFFYKFLKDDERRRQIRNLLFLSDDDWMFLCNYVAGFRRGRHSRADRERAASLKNKLRRNVAAEMSREHSDEWDAFFRRPSTRKAAPKGKPKKHQKDPV